MKKGVQVFHWKFDLVPENKAANKAVVVLKTHYINTKKQELSTASTYEHNLLDERFVVDRHWCHMSAKFGVFVYDDHSKLPTLLFYF